VRLFAEEFLDDGAHGGHPRHAAHQNHFVDLGGRESGVFQSAAARIFRALEQRVAELFELGAGERIIQVLRPGGIGGDEGQIDIRAHYG